MRLYPLTGHAKHCSEEKRKLIRNLIQSGKNWSGWGNTMQCKYEKPPDNRGHRRILPKVVERNIVRYAKTRPIMSAVEIRNQLNLACGVHIARRLRDYYLYARRPHKGSLKKITKHDVLNLLMNIWPGLKCRKHIIYGRKGPRAYVWLRSYTEYDPRYTTKTLKHSGQI